VKGALRWFGARIGRKGIQVAATASIASRPAGATT
jgi:hypothetical protein